MQIPTASKKGPIFKEVTVGCGVAFTPDGTRYTVEARVVEINEEKQTLLVERVNDFKVWIEAGRVHDVLSTGVYQMNQAQANTDVNNP